MRYAENKGTDKTEKLKRNNTGTEYFIRQDRRILPCYESADISGRFSSSAELSSGDKSVGRRKISSDRK